MGSDRTPFEPELGQMAFSNTRWQEHAMVDFVEEGLLELSRAIVRAQGRDPDRDLGPAENSGEIFENGVFTMRAYCWCDGAESHGDGCPVNFEHKPSGFSASWYKWVGRGASQDRPITQAEWGQIMTDCLRSLEVTPAM